MSRRSLLLVDDDPTIRVALRGFFRNSGYEVEVANSVKEATEVLQRVVPDAAILDYALPDGTAFDLLPRFVSAAPNCPVLLLTGHGSIDLAVRAIQSGAESFLTKPVDLEAVLALVERLIESRRARQVVRAGKIREERATFDPFTGTSALIRELAQESNRALETASPVLILGETGSGKGVLANWLHRNGPRASEPFVDLNCAGLSRELTESELFGHEKGAFTGAAATKSGLLEIAHRGTVFLDEIGDMDLAVQAKLLKVIEDGRLRRVGGVEDRRVDIRIVAATHHPLIELVRGKRFREDLYYRLSVIPLHVPSLAERREDIPLLAARVLEHLGLELGRPGLALDPDALALLGREAWPGNLREMRNSLERAALHARGSTIRAENLRLPGAKAPSRSQRPDGGRTLQELEAQHIRDALEIENGNVDRVAVRLDIPRSTLYLKLKKLGIKSGA